MYIEKVLDLWVQLMKNGGKNKSVAFIILFSVIILKISWINANGWVQQKHTQSINNLEAGLSLKFYQ